MNLSKVHLLSNNVLFKPGEEEYEFLKANLTENITLTWGEDLPVPADCEVLVGGRPERRHISGCPNLKALIIPFAGIHEETLLMMRDFPSVTVYNIHYNGALVAEMAMALLLSAARFVIPYDRALRNGDWRPRYDPFPSMMLHGKTALVLGFGEIGQRIGRACHALGMHVVGVRRDLTKAVTLDYPAEVFSVQSLPSLLPRTNALLIALPGTHATAGLIGEEQIRLLPAGAVLVNVGRGAIVDQGALYRALKERRLLAAGVDVWYTYPESLEAQHQTLPADFPFQELDNMVMSPHCASFTTDAEQVRMQHVAFVLNDLAAGVPVSNRIDLELGY